VSVWDEYKTIFSEDNLKKIYEENIVLSNSTGIDNISHKIFWKILDEQISIISRKAISGTYKFTKYKLKLISKGRGKIPRDISIPTIRDRITLRALCDFLQIRFSALNFMLPQYVIRDVKKHMDSGKYTGYIKLDVTNFYPSIKHKELKSRLKKRIKNKEILNIIESSIISPTVAKASFKESNNKCGVPQGLSISNILAAIFLSNIDKRFNEFENIKYYRYVDDVLVLCPKEISTDIANKITKQFNRIGLKIHCPIKVPEKSSIGVIGVDDFSYLGYSFIDNLVSARKASVDKLRESILSIFTGYKYSKLKKEPFLEWRLNLRITGCIFNNKTKGWIFFFSEINDEGLLHELDYFVRKLCKRYSVTITPKLFVRTFFQIKHNKYDSNYIPNFDRYDIDDMVNVLSKYFSKSTKGMTDVEIEYNFKKRISRQVKDLETDIMDFNY